MRSTSLALAALAALSIPNAAAAQRIVADISLQQGPVTGRIVIGDPYPYGPHTVVAAYPRDHDRREYRTVTVYRVHRGPGWYGHHGFRRARVWYDADRGRYYDRYTAPYAGLREIVVYERDGRYYRDDGRNDDRRWHDRAEDFDDRD
jgi:hypothetical protein